MITVVTCRCGSTEQLARRFLNEAGCPNPLEVPLYEGKEASLSFANSLLQYPEAGMLANYVKNSSKWVIIVGWNEKGFRWADIVHSPTASRVEGQLIVETFA